HPGKAGGELPERRGPGGNGTTVGAAAIGVERLMENGLDARTHLLLHSMVAIDIMRRRHAERLGHRQHAGVLARAIVVNRRRRLPAVAQLLPRRPEGLGMRSAF